MCYVEYDLLFFPLSAGFKLSSEQKEDGNFQLFSVYLVILLEERCRESLQGLCILLCGARVLYWRSAVVGALLFRKCVQYSLDAGKC